MCLFSREHYLAAAGAGIDVDALGAQLQDEGAKAFVQSWNDLLGCIGAKSEPITKAS